MSKQNATTEKAYAKINLALDVTGRLPNGYHTVRMVMENISLHDTLTISVSDTPGIRLSCVAHPSLRLSEPLSCGDDNLIIRAARMLIKNEDDIGLEIALDKRIPLAAGLAGGSADAAAALKGINRLLSLGLTDDELCNIGVGLGADIPYCIKGGSMLAEGIGEKLSPLPAPPEAYLIIVKPDANVSTASVYERIDGAISPARPDVDGMIRALDDGDLRGICHRLRNMLRDVTISDLPVICELECTLRERGALGALMSGSGPTVFGIFDDKRLCERALTDIRGLYPDMYATYAEWKVERLT